MILCYHALGQILFIIYKQNPLQFFDDNLSFNFFARTAHDQNIRPWEVPDSEHPISGKYHNPQIKLSLNLKNHLLLLIIFIIIIININHPHFASLGANLQSPIAHSLFLVHTNRVSKSETPSCHNNNHFSSVIPSFSSPIHQHIHHTRYIMTPSYTSSVILTRLLFSSSSYTPTTDTCS